MQVIPVIDLKDGEVVAACMGNRDLYKPMKSPLCRSSNPFTVIDAFLDLHKFRTLYLADLNAITGNGDHSELIYEIAQSYSHLDFWVDSGKKLADFSHSNNNVTPVIGTESQTEPVISPSTANFILSLDYRANHQLGNTSLFDDTSFWPQRLIVMNLNKVGSNTGPDFNKLQTLIGKYPDKDFVAAGGIRHYQDLVDLAGMGVHHALLASALHYGNISRQDLQNLKKLQAKKYPA
jgi:phosphoribosylformimino-5-aminoimidazole carboxamide ribotide isomerase